MKLFLRFTKSFKELSFIIKRDDCFVINTENDSYFCYPSKKNVVTKLAFATEEMFLLSKGN